MLKVLKFQRSFFTTTTKKLNQKQTYRILFFGSDNFSVPSLKSLINESKNPDTFVKSIEAVVPPDKKTGRGYKEVATSPVKKFAKEYDLKIHEAPPKSLEGWEVPKTNFDFAIVVSFGYFLTPSILKSFTKGSINVHPSLLPKYRGASPIQYTILNNDKITGITIQELHHETFDAGKVLRQISIEVPPNSTYTTLEPHLATKGAELLIDTLKNFDYHKDNTKEQDALKIIKAPKIRKEMSEIKWSQISAQQLEQLYRAISHQYPLSTKFNNKIIQLHNISLPSSQQQLLFQHGKTLRPGTILIRHPEQLSPVAYVVCAGNSFITFNNVKVEGKKEVSILDWINGYQIKSEEMMFDE
ncbi:4323_t:CDS:2 [Funneliformis geosporum]|uniref:Methionyl-tRNA formyltransferase, mitochondrial n=1 Tax=Funneliformis geosporum TaxID=1117311 RepID=A0A9W4WX66_9GLOM|nr:4323_t:CDS:2 [Funneliformis geosporum]CAI2185744.1 12647_t:CDS:2 [Funneliformis geosporum]